MTKFILVECIDRDIFKKGVYYSWEEAHEDMVKRVALTVDEEITCDENGYAFGDNWGIQKWDAWIDSPKNHTFDDYDYAILEV